MNADRYGTIVCIHKCTFCISSDGLLYLIGSLDGEIDKNPCQQIHPNLNNIISVVCGKHHALCLDTSGNVYIFTNEYFKSIRKTSRYRMESCSELFERTKKKFLGHETSPHIFEPYKIALPTIKQISFRDDIAFCVSESGNVYSFGYKTNLNYDTFLNFYSPHKISSLKDVEFVECGSGYAIFKTHSEEIYCWGKNNLGQLGIGNTYNQPNPFKSTICPDNIIDIKCGENHTLILTSSQEIYSCGSNRFGQLGRETDEYFSAVFQKIDNIPEIIRIECGDGNSMAIDIDNDLFVFGNNSNGELGLNDILHRDEPTKNPLLSNIIDISSGRDHTFVKTSNNEIYAFGNNKYSQLGIKTQNNRQITPIRVFEDNEDIWFSNINKSKAKSARK